ncbi:MAG: YajQ family cyclic di-GMP-binding protein, partial [Deltaproteobacteria bacterium]
REIGQRFDFKGAKTEVRREENAIHLHTADDFKLRALGDILREKLARRQVPLKALLAGPIEPGPAGTAKQKLDLQQGIPVEKARDIVKLVKDMKTKLQVAIQGDQVRVSGKKKDDLQAVVQRLRAEDLGVAMQFVNFRD